jgi:hypothetical protein
VLLALGPLVSIAQATRHSKIEPGKNVATAGGSSSLAFTGIDVWVLVLIAAGLLATGLVMRRWSARSARS